MISVAVLTGLFRVRVQSRLCASHAWTWGIVTSKHKNSLSISTAVVAHLATPVRTTLGPSSRTSAADARLSDEGIWDLGALL